MHKVNSTIDRSQRTVLVVDDTPATRYSTCRILRAAGFQIAEAASGSDGFHRARAGNISAVVLDVHLPDIDGFTVCRMLREMPETLVLPVLHLSATYVESSDKVAGQNSGADAYLEHPVEPAILVATLQALIRARIAEEQLRETEQRYRQLLLEREQAARANAERHSRTKDDFVAVLSHELRNPLNAILMNVHVLLRKEPPPEYTRGLDAIRRNAQTQARIISDILDVSRINSGKLTLQREMADPAALVQSSIDAMRQQLDSRQLELVLDAQPAGLVLLDPARFQQIFWNIFNNAIKFSHPGGCVHVALQRTSEQLELTVTDTGKGIAPAFLDRVFEKFTQSEAPGKRASGGLGLGLSIVKHLAELHGGDVELTSQGLGAGTTARMWLPLQPTADGSAALDSQAGALDDAALAGLSGRRVLVVEDDRDAAEMLGLILEDRGAQVCIVGDHDSGLAALQAQRPDLLLSDIGLPGKDGYALIRQLRSQEASGGLARLPAIALTAFGRPDDRAMALAAGFDAHVAKPFEPQALLNAMLRLAV